MKEFFLWKIICFIRKLIDFHIFSGIKNDVAQIVTLNDEAMSTNSVLLELAKILIEKLCKKSFMIGNKRILFSISFNSHL